VEPALPKDCPVVLKDYPAELCALARLKPDNPKVAERWELYLGGIEIANAYSELTDPVEQRARFEHWGEQRRALGKEVYPIDEEFIQALETMPPASGVALGVDRLLMPLEGWPKAGVGSGDWIVGLEWLQTFPPRLEGLQPFQPYKF